MTLYESATKPNGHIPRAVPMNPVDVQEYIAIACTLCGADSLSGCIRVAWNGRFSARMGDGRWSPRLGLGFIRLSSRLWAKASHDQKIETITHEACHVIADYTFGGRQRHGLAWQEMMRRCGYQNSQRCHRVDTAAIHARRLRRRMVAACGCPDGILITTVTARRVQAGTVYVCRACGQRLTLPQAGQPTPRE